MANPEHLAILKQSVEVWNQWRRENPDPEIEPDLREADLSGANLREANLFGADLRKARLSRADLSGTDLSGVRLIGADLRGAYLRKARLLRAYLSRARLNGVDLRGAHLIGTRLFEADLNEAVCLATVFANVDLSEAKHLETIKHNGPSTVGIDTLVKSKGKIPEIFLRGCGVPEELISHLKYFFTTSVIEFYSCFISHSHADKAFAQRVHDRLQAKGIRCWLDEKQILPGHDILTEVDRGIRLWDKTLLCASRESLHSGWVDTELTKALEKERELTKEHRQRVFALIPLDIDGYLLSKEYQSPIKSEITRRSVAEFKGWDGEGGNAIFEAQIKRVIKALRTDEGREPPPPPKLGQRS